MYTKLRPYFFSLAFMVSHCALAAEEFSDESFEETAITNFPKEESFETEDGFLVFTLETAVVRALQYNRQMVGQYESLQKSQLGLQLAETEFELKIDPNGQAGYTGGGRGGSGGTAGAGVDLAKKFSYGTRFTLSPSFTKSGHFFHTNIKTTITQPLLKGFGQEYTLSGVRASQFALRSALRALYLSQVSLINKTLSSCYEVIRQEETLKLNQESFDRLRQFRDAAKMKEKIGLADGMDVLRAEIELKQAEEQLHNVKERMQEAHDVLKELLALPLDYTIKVEAPMVYEKMRTNQDEAIQTALQNRIELDQALDQYDESCRLSKLAKQNLLPDINLVLTYNNLGSHHDFFRSCTQAYREHGWGVGFTTSSEINRDAEQIAFQQSLLAIAGSERGDQQTSDNVILDVKRALRTLSRSATKIEVQSQQIKNAEGELSLSRVKFDHGQANNFDVIQAEKNYRSAQGNYMNALIEYILGEYQLCTSLGLLITKPLIE